MKILFTKSNNIVSKIIRYVLNEPVSHVVLQFENGMIIHSDFLGVSIQWQKEYFSRKIKNEALYSIEYNCEVSDEELIKIIMDSVASKPYDFKAVSYFTLCSLLHKFTGIRITRNEWNNKNEYICTEMVELLPGKIQSVLKNVDLSITSPYRLYKILESNI